jgi:hypothetical protein
MPRSSMWWSGGQLTVGVALELPAALMHGPMMRPAE